ncbi:MAG: inositol monophosphatase [Planctomycetes bacterium]|nr:inositol monophosphatase [Planctomycetota bacterium]
MQEFVITALSVQMPNVLRWAGGIARLLRLYNIRLEGKQSGSAGTDALTLADLSLQELIVSALRDTDPIFRYCRIDAEESVGDLTLFPSDAPLTIGIDPIDGTRIYRDHDGDGYGVMLHLRSKSSVLYSLVFVPELGPHGAWLEATGDRLVCGPDDPSRSALDVLRSLPALDLGSPPTTKKIYVNGFQHRTTEAARRVSQTGLTGVLLSDLPGRPYEQLARGVVQGALLHSPNVYDFPVIAHVARLYGGDAVFVDSGEPVEFDNVWLDPKARMLRLPGIVACSTNHDDLQTLCNLARNWHPDRYQDGESLEG